MSLPVSHSHVTGKTLIVLPNACPKAIDEGVSDVHAARKERLGGKMVCIPAWGHPKKSR